VRFRIYFHDREARQSSNQKPESPAKTQRRKGKEQQFRTLRLGDLAGVMSFLRWVGYRQGQA
jgi:hypothetical protein